MKRRETTTIRPVRGRQWSKVAAGAIALTVMAVFVATPLFFMVLTSMKPTADVDAGKLGITTFTLENFIQIFSSNISIGSFYSDTGVMVPVLNSTMVALAATLVSVIIGALAAYGMTMTDMRGKRALSIYVLFAYVFPSFILLIPVSIVLHRFGLTDTLAGLTLAHMIITVPFATWMMRGYFLTIPRELEEAARVDGCSRWQSLIRVIMPVAAPGVATAAIFAFTQSWDELLFALVLMSSQTNYTLPVVSTFLVFGDVYHWGPLMAIGVISALPPAALYLFVQRYIVSGMTAGSVKG